MEKESLVGRNSTHRSRPPALQTRPEKGPGWVGMFGDSFCLPKGFGKRTDGISNINKIDFAQTRPVPGFSLSQAFLFKSIPFQKSHKSRAALIRLSRGWFGGSRRTGRDREVRYPPSLLRGVRSRIHPRHSGGCPERQRG